MGTLPRKSWRASSLPSRRVTPGDPVRHFGFCVPVIRAKPPKASPVLAPNPVSANPGPVPAVDPVSTPIANQSEAPQIPEQCLQIFTQANQDQPPTAHRFPSPELAVRRMRSRRRTKRPGCLGMDRRSSENAAGQAHNLLPYTTALVRKKMAQTLQRNVQPKTHQILTLNREKSARKPTSDPGSQTDIASNALARRTIAIPEAALSSLPNTARLPCCAPWSRFPMTTKATFRSDCPGVAGCVFQGCHQR